MKTLALIDVAGIFRANWAASQGQEVSEAYSQTLKRVHELRQGYDHCAICLDSPPYRRKQISADYKAQRDKPAENMLGQYARVKQRLADDGLPVFSAPGYEADDVIATLVTQAVSLPEAERMAVTVISADKDLLQLVNDEAHVNAFSFQNMVSFDEAAVRAKFGVSPAGMLDALALQGDSSDNVPGVKGVGIKTAALVVNSGPGLDGALAGEAISGLTPRLAEAIADSADAVRLARRLIALETDAPVKIEDVFVRRAPKVSEASGPRNLEGEDEAEGEVVEASFDDEPKPGAAQPVATVTPINASVASSGASSAPKTEKGPPVAPKAPAAMVRVEPSFDLTLEPRNNTAALEVAKVIFESGLYPRLGSAAAIYVVILRGRELGLTVGASLDSLHFFEGKPAMGAHLIIDRAMRHPDCEWFRFVGGDATYAEYATKTRSYPEIIKHRYTIQQAQQAGVCPVNIRTSPEWVNQKDIRTAWEKRPEELIRKTCGVQLARIVYPGASAGLYAIEELSAA